MLDREIKREISPSELTLLINEEFQNTSPALLDEWVIKLLAEPKNHPSVRTAFQELWNEKEEPSIYFLKVMAIIHNSPFKDLCLQYSKDGKFGTQEMEFMKWVIS